MPDCKNCSNKDWKNHYMMAQKENTIGRKSERFREINQYNFQEIILGSILSLN